MDTNLRLAFRNWHRQLQDADFARRRFGSPAGHAALTAFARARADVFNGTTWGNPDSSPPGTWQSDDPGHYGLNDHDANGALRFVGYVTTEISQRRIEDPISTDPDKAGGWYDNPYGESRKNGDGLVTGVVYQLPATKNGRTRFVGGYDFRGTDAGVTLDLSRVFEAKNTGGGSGRWQPNEDAAAIRAAYHANRLAAAAAEKEREYKTAYAAGSAFASLGEEVETTREALAALLRERRAVRAAAPSVPTICSVLRDSAIAMVRSIQKARRTRAALARGDGDDGTGHYSPTLYFSTHDARLREAFNDGAGDDILQPIAG